MLIRMCHKVEFERQINLSSNLQNAPFLALCKNTHSLRLTRNNWWLAGKQSSG